MLFSAEFTNGEQWLKVKRISLGAWKEVIECRTIDLCCESGGDEFEFVRRRHFLFPLEPMNFWLSDEFGWLVDSSSLSSKEETWSLYLTSIRREHTLGIKLYSEIAVESWNSIYVLIMSSALQMMKYGSRNRIWRSLTEDAWICLQDESGMWNSW